MERIVSHISDYMSYLTDQCGLMVSIHDIRYDGSKMFEGKLDILTKFNLHMNPYCLFLKINDELWYDCIKSQRPVFDKCRWCGAFFGMCHAGVCEFIYPISAGGNTIGFVSVSGYRPAEGSELWNKAMHKLDKLCMRYELDRGRVMEMYTSSLTPELPDRKLIDTLINPLCDMLQLAYGEYISCSKGDAQAGTNNRLYYDICNKILHDHTNKISLKTLSEHFNYSESYISHLFKKNSGMTINQYVNSLRIAEAKGMLAATRMSVQEIAMTVGFSDSNYFTNVFRALVGVSPREWRKSNPDK